MDKDYILNGNKLIAEFIGTLKSPNKETIWFKNYNPILNKKMVFINQLKYHDSWDWLMTCVEKIEEMDVVASFQIEQPTIYIWASSESSTFEDIEVDIFNRSKIEAVYEACIKFINWYNGNK